MRLNTVVGALPRWRGVPGRPTVLRCGRDCAQARVRCLGEYTLTVPLYTSVAYSLAAWAARISMRSAQR